MKNRNYKTLWMSFLNGEQNSLKNGNYGRRGLYSKEIKGEKGRRCGMNRDERLCKIYRKWFKIGFKQRLRYLYNPNLWIDVHDSFDINYEYEVTFIESLPWNNRWTYLGYKDGYDSVNPFMYANKMPDESCIKEIFNSRRYRN